VPSPGTGLVPLRSRHWIEPGAASGGHETDVDVIRTAARMSRVPATSVSEAVAVLGATALSTPATSARTATLPTRDARLSKVSSARSSWPPTWPYDIERSGIKQPGVRQL